MADSTSVLPLPALTATRPLRSASQPAPAPTGLIPDFARFGEWGERVRIVRDGCTGALAYEMATHPRRHEWSSGRLWKDCLETKGHLVREYRIVRLDGPSYFLPAGEVVFKVVENPIQLPDNPPQGVMMRHLEAMMAHPLAKFYLLEPVFTMEPYYRLYTAGDLRTEAAGDRAECERLAWQWGWAHRTGQWAGERAREAGATLLRGAAWALEQLARPVARRSSTVPHLDADDFAAILADETLVELARRADGHGRGGDAQRLKRAVQELRWRVSIDPVLCFELEVRPGELWFEAHWYTGMDGRRYVHY